MTTSKTIAMNQTTFVVSPAKALEQVFFYIYFVEQGQSKREFHTTTQQGLKKAEDECRKKNENNKIQRNRIRR